MKVHGNAYKLIIGISCFSNFAEEIDKQGKPGRAGIRSI